MNAVEIGERVRSARSRRGISQEDLARKVNSGQSTIDRIEKGQWKRMPSALPKVWSALSLPMNEIIDDPGQVSFTPSERILVGERNLRVYGAAEAGAGTIILTSDPVDYVRRPAPLAEVKDGYGLIIINESMVPEFKPGDTVLVHPHLPPVRDEACVFYADDGQGTVRATIKSFVRATEASWFVEQWNPPKKFTLDRKEWQKCHRVVGKYSRR